MWSGSLITNYSGSLTGAHQRIDRIAFRSVRRLDKNNLLPSLKDILHFEGKNGPDGIKAKSPAQDEPWHFFNPYNEDDHDVINFIQNHYISLVKALRETNKQRAAFELAWLAHAVVDGLTPAHHYPYESELEKLRGESKHTRHTIKKKLIIPGPTKVQMIQNNWRMWGAKGLFTTHGTFELGIAMLLVGYKSKSQNPIDNTSEIRRSGIGNYYRSLAKKIADKDYYNRYYKSGWNIKLSKDIHQNLIPDIISAVSSIWLSALYEAQGGSDS